MPDLRGATGSGRTGAYDPRGLAPWIALLAAFALFAVASLAVPHARAQAPGFSLHSTGLEEGVAGPPRDFTLGDYRGHVVVLDLMAVACESCRELTSRVLLPLWSQRGGEKAFTILSVDVWADPAMPDWQAGWETQSRLLDLQVETGVPWRHALDTDGVWQKYDVGALPRVLVVDGQGRIAYDHVGIPKLAELQEAIRDAQPPA